MNLKIGLLALASIIGTASALYSAGPCMNDVWQSTENSGTELSCNANEVSTTVLGIDGPTACKKGEIIVVNITTSIYFRASRYDFAIYTLTDNTGASDPIFGSECAVDVLGQEDANFAPQHIKNQDSDACFDVVAKSGWTLEKFKFQDNLRVPCEGEPGTTTRTVHIQNCFSWRTNGQDKLCDSKHPAYPGASSKCDCASMDLGILIYEDQPPSIAPSPAVSFAPSSDPSSSPSVTAMPSSVPSLAPSTSSEPSLMPSLNPTLSSQPSSEPSPSPSVSAEPTSVPSLAPSTSSAPSSEPSLNPTLSSQPSSEPSSPPLVTAMPSSVPSLAPSTSSSPSSMPSLNPTLSSQPSSEPSSSPSVSAEPTSVPSLAPSTSSSPSSEPSLNPTLSSQPSSEPSLSPSVSSKPSDMPSLQPTLSTAPSFHPTSTPSVSPSSSPSSVAGVGGLVWDDLNGDGLIDSGETMLPSMEVSLLDEGGFIVKTTTSATDGRYFFSGLLPDTYSITVVSGAEYQFSPVVSGGNQMRSSTVVSGDNQIVPSGTGQGTSNPITLSGGEERDDMHAGMYKPIIIGNKVWNDLNGNGIQETGEPGMSSVEVALVDGSGTVVETTETDVNGYYRFSGLPPGRYSVEFQLPSGYAFTHSAEVLGDIQLDGFPVAGADGSFLLADVTSDANVETGKTEQVDVVSGDVNLSLDAGIYVPAKITGFVWHDLNANGIQEDGEEGLEGAVVTLFNDASDPFGVAVSDSTGAYIFEGLRPDSYYGLFETPDEEYFMSPTGQGNSDTDSDFDPDSKVNSLVALLSGDENSGNFDAGLYKYASVGNFVWLDSAADGIQGADEIGFPFPVTINLYNMYNELLITTVSNKTGAYLFEDLMPGYYEIEFIMEEGDILSPPFRGNDQQLDSDVNPTTKRAEVTLVSGEENFSVDAGIIANAPYYPDWTWDVQVCTNDGFDPEWMTTNNEGEQIYLYRNKEECCQNHFWWRMAQCMANEEYKFYRNGEICDSKIEFEDWESNSPAAWTDTKLFNTLDECCANLFSYDYSGCMGRSPVMFKFDFCIDIGSLLPPIDCQTADIYANVLEDAINLGLGDASDANITRVGDASLTKVDGSTKCGGSLEGQDFINDLTGTIGQPDLTNLPDSTAVCGVITTESYDCTKDDCLNTIYQNIVSGLSVYVDDGSLTTNLNSLATTRLPPVEELQVADGISGSLSTYNLLLPTTISSQLGDLKYFKDNNSCGQKTAFASWETKYNTLLDCCSANFNWKLNDCCTEGGGCVSSEPPPTTTSTTAATSTATTTTTTTTTTTQNLVTSTTSTIPVTTTTSTTAATTTTTTTKVPVTTTTSTAQTTTEVPVTTTTSTAQTTTEVPVTTTTTTSTAQTTTEVPVTTTTSTAQTTTEVPVTTTTTTSTAQTTTEVPVTTTTSTAQTTTEVPVTTTTSTAQTTTEVPVTTTTSTAQTTTEVPVTTTTTTSTAQTTTEVPVTTTTSTAQTTTEVPVTTTTSTAQTTTEAPVTTSTSTAQTTTEVPVTTTTSTAQTTTEVPLTTTTSTAQTTTEVPVTTTTSTAQTTTEAPVSTTTSTAQTTTEVPATTTTAPVFRFFADQSFGAEKLCDLKPLSEFESWETPYTELKECCTSKFSWDYANCCAGDSLGGCGDPSPTVKYYPTWQDGKLCQSKTSFGGWEQKFDTLKDCCTSLFGYAYEACCQSDGMGGCV